VVNDTLNNWILAAAFTIMVLCIGAALDRNSSTGASESDTALIRRDQAAQQVCERRPFEWLDNQTLLCLNEQQQHTTSQTTPSNSK
jgi:hypothetical protein